MRHEAAFYAAKAQTIAALAHAVRLQILDQLAGGEASAGDLVRALELPQPLISQHLAVLRGAGIVLRRRDGNRQAYRLANVKIAVACGLMGEILVDLLGAEQERLAPLVRAR